MCDGNRRWASEMGYVDPNDGHRVGAERIKELLRWCDEARIEHVTLWLLSTDNLSRPAAELDPLLQIIEDLVDRAGRGRQPVAAAHGRRARPAARPAGRRRSRRRRSARSAATGGAQVNIAVGYGGRREIADAVRSLLQEHARGGGTLEELAEILDVDHIAEHLYTRGQPDPDLVIRTSGEQRLSGFLLWQSAHSEFYFCDVNWPDFRKTDFLRALRSLRQPPAPLRLLIPPLADPRRPWWQGHDRRPIGRMCPVRRCTTLDPPLRYFRTRGALDGGEV